LSTIQSNTVNILGNLTKMNTTLTAVYSAVQSMGSELSSVYNAVSSMNSTVQSMGSTLSSMNKTLSSLPGQVSTIISDLSNMNATLMKIYNIVSTLNLTGGVPEVLSGTGAERFMFRAGDAEDLVGRVEELIGLGVEGVMEVGEEVKGVVRRRLEESASRLPEVFMEVLSGD